MKRDPLFRRYARFWRSDPRRDVDEELAFHLAMRADEEERRGVPREVAERAARERFGDVKDIHAAVEQLAVRRHARGRRTGLWDACQQDVRYALRMLIANPGYAIVVTLTLALGIGANLGIFTLVQSVLVRPLPFPQPDQLVRVYDDLTGANANDVGMSVPEMEDLTRSGVFAGISGIVSASTAMAGGDHVERIELLGTSPNYFEVLKASASRGRVFGQAEWKPGFLNGAVISDALWKRQFGADPHVLGRTIRLDEDAYTIIGVMPADFRHPGATLAGDVDVWAATGFAAPPFPTPPSRSTRFLPGAIARLNAGISRSEAQARLNALVAQLKRSYPHDYPRQQGWAIRLAPVQASLTGSVRPTLIILLVAVTLVLLIVCVNVASLMLARSLPRRREFALRQALGASRGRVVRQLLTESLLISTLGGVAAAIGLRLARGSLIRMLPPDIPRLNEVHSDWKVAVGALVVSLVTGVIVGVGPALHATAVDPQVELKAGGRTGGGSGVRQARARSGLVVVEVAMSVVLLIAAGLLIRSFVAVLKQDPGLDPKELVAGQIWVPVPNNPEANKYLTTSQESALARRLLDAFRHMPGVTYAALGTPSDVPLLGNASTARAFSLPDESSTRENDHAAVFGAVSADYFRALGVRIDTGRAFTDHDDESAPGVAIVNEAFVRAFSAIRDPIGRRVRSGSGVEFRIVGVVRDVRSNSLDIAPAPHVYLSILQRPSVALAAVIRTHSDLRTARDALTEIVRTIDPDLPVFAVRTMDDLLAASLTRRRFALSLMSVFAISAMLLAGLGLYGVMAFAVRQRSQEFGVRQALGASAKDILALAVRPGVRLTTIGILIGIAVAFAVTRLMSAMLFGVSATDPLTFLAVPALLGIVAIGACAVPGFHATRVSPIRALKD